MSSSGGKCFRDRSDGVNVRVLIFENAITMANAKEHILHEHEGLLATSTPDWQGLVELDVDFAAKQRARRDIIVRGVDNRYKGGAEGGYKSGRAKKNCVGSVI
jgi:hypothetical protein